MIVHREEFTVNEKVIIYEIEDLSFEAPNGSLVSNFVGYKIENEIRELITPYFRYYNVSRDYVESFFPHEIKKCPCCGHSNKTRIKGKVLPL